MRINVDTTHITAESRVVISASLFSVHGCVASAGDVSSPVSHSTTSGR